MAFTDAIPVNRVSSSSATYGSATRTSRWTPKNRNQSVNISNETMERIAREKLANAIKYKIGYNRSGSFETRAPAGLKFSAKA